MAKEIRDVEVKKAVSVWVDELPDTLIDVGLAEMDEKNKKTLLSVLSIYLCNAYREGYARGHEVGYGDGNEDGYEEGSEEGARAGENVFVDGVWK